MLRGVTLEDLDTIYIWENDPSLWEFGTYGAQYTMAELCSSLILESQSLILDGQLRKMIYCEDVAVGVVDLFEYNHNLNSAGVGILIDSAHRGRGFASAALRGVELLLASEYGIEKLWSNVAQSNLSSVNLFRGCGYEESAQEGELFLFQKNIKKNNI
ncbi:MAG: GNAT family N-acetyltransferase [Rikenellaceae bacterium]